MGKDKIYWARMDGLAYALDIVKAGGVEALEKEIEIRGAHFVPLELTEEKRIKLGEVLSNRIIATMVPTIMFVLSNNFGFGKVRLLRWKDEFMKLCNMMAHCDPMGMPYETTRDYANVLHDKYGLEFDWDTIDEVEADNATLPQLCQIDYVIDLLEEKGQKEAAKIIRGYKRGGK